MELQDLAAGICKLNHLLCDSPLVVLDLTMPRKSGWEALEEIRKIKADVPVIVSSGYSIEGGAEAAIERGANAFLPKPYRAQQLLSTVLEVLAHEDSPPPKLPA